MNRTKEREAFDVYWQLGTSRSLATLERELKSRGQKVSLRTLESWSTRFDWQRRLLHLERKAHEAAQEARIVAIREMNERQAREGILLQQRGTEWIQALPPGEVTAEAAVRSIIEGAKLERLSRGESTDRTVVGDDDPRLMEMTDEQLDKLLDLSRTADLEGEAPPES